MPDPALDEYVKSALALQGYRLSDPVIEEVAVQFARIHAIASDLLNAQIDPSIEPVPALIK